MSRATFKESIRRSTILPAFSQSLAEVHFHPHTDFASLQVFTCDRLSCVLTKEACAANYTRANAPISCKGCPIGSAHANGQHYRNETDRHTRAEAARALACIRCEKSAHTNKRLIGRMRLVRSATLCVSCFNRQRECEKGANSKGAMPRLVLKPASVSIEKEGVRSTLDIGLRMNWHECARYVERIHADATAIEIVFDGETIQQYSLWSPLPFSPWEPGMVRDEKPSKPKRTNTNRSTRITSKKTSAAASLVDWDDWDTPLYKLGKPVESDESDADSSRQARRCGWLQPLSEEDAAYHASFEEGDANERFLARNGYYGERSTLDDALDPESIAAHGFGDSDGLAEFIEWLCEDWPSSAIKAAKPSLSALAKAHGISSTLAHYRLRTRGTVEFPLDANGSVLQTRNTSSINGVHWAVKRNKWYARGYQAGRAVHLGYFDAIEDAAAARAAFDNKPAGPYAPVADAIAPSEVAEPVSEPHDKPAETIAPTVEPEAVSAPVRDPIAEAINKLESIKKPSRKVRRELGRLYEKQERRAQLQAAAPAPSAPRISGARQIAIASRALAIFDSMKHAAT
ncbi:hypothetical protein PQR64_35760 [Paraburkholderia phytofirmans]|uniref:hypothetical protein n=1 Tax=Paraburkholderia phytofirmans TaxID=261302 RepID=UPI0038B6DD61